MTGQPLPKVTPPGDMHLLTRHARRSKAEATGMGTRLRLLGQAAGDLAAMLAVYALGALITIGERVRQSRLDALNHDPFGDGYYDWDDDPEGRAW